MEEPAYVREICFDTETTGFRAKEGDRLIEIGCVELSRYGISENKFHRFINPQRDIPEEAIRIHNITNEMVADKPTFEEIADEFLEFIKGAKLIAHNAPFDESFLDQELTRIGKGKLRDHCVDVIDSLEISRKVFPQQQNSLDALCKRLGVDLTSRNDGHGALIDAQLLAQVYLVLKQDQESMDIDSLTLSGKKLDDIEDTHIVIKASEEDLKAHEAFLELLAKKCKGTPLYKMEDEEFKALREKEQESINSKKAKMEQFIASL